MTQRYRFLVYAPQNAGDLAGEIGRADYSYFFVMRYFEPALRELGEVVVLTDPHETPPPAPELVEGPVRGERPPSVSTSSTDGVHDVRLLFMPPHSVPLDLPAPAIPVFAWEYTTIPTDPWGGEERNDWRVVLRASPGAVTHSRFAADAVRRAMGPRYPVVSLPAPVWDRYAALYQPDRPAVLPDWTLDVHGAVMDSRVLALPDGELAAPDLQPSEHSVALSGVVYTAVLNPNDGRKNWNDIITAFVWAFRDNPDATLLLKLVHFDAARACRPVYSNMSLLAPYRCRIVAVHSYLEPNCYERLVQGSSFIVNSSRGEGQCLPLMEFMSAGVPALSCAHTAMAEYVTDEDGFVVPHTQEWTHWPHDPRRFLRCFTYWPDWDALRQAFEDSFRLVRDDPDRYQQMRAAASAALHEYCSVAMVRAGLADFLNGLPAMSAAGPEAAEVPA